MSASTELLYEEVNKSHEKIKLLVESGKDCSQEQENLRNLLLKLNAATSALNENKILKG